MIVKSGKQNVIVFLKIGMENVNGVVAILIRLMFIINMELRSRNMRFSVQNVMQTIMENLR